MATQRILLYGCEIWFDGYVKTKTKLNEVERAPLLSLTKTYRTISYEGTQVLAGVIPLYLMTEVEATVLRSNLLGIESRAFGIDIPVLKLPVVWQHPASYHSVRWDCRYTGLEVFTDGSRLKIDDVFQTGGGFVAYINGAEFHTHGFIIKNH